MAILSKVYIIVCLLLNVLMCQRQDHLVYSINKHHPEAMAMAKHPRSYDWENPNPIRSSQMGAAICPAEDPNDVRFENHSNVKQNWKNFAKDEDDGEDLDMAARGDDDDDEEGDEGSSTGMDDTNGDDPALLARISCLMSSLDKHIKAIVCNVNNIKSHLSSLKKPGNCGKTPEDKEPKENKMQCPKKTLDFQEKQKDNQCSSNGASGQDLNTYTPFYVKYHPKNMEDISPQGSGAYPQNSGDISPPGTEIYPQNSGEISPPGTGIYSQNIERISPPGTAIYSQNSGGISPPGPGTYLPKRVEISSPGSGAYSQNSGEISPPGSGINFENKGDISPAGSGNNFKNSGEIAPPGFKNSGDISLPGPGTYPQNSGYISPPGSGFKLQKIIYPSPVSFNHKPYEEYESKLQRLMANRDAIERNVMRMLAPRQGERM